MHSSCFYHFTPDASWKLQLHKHQVPIYIYRHLTSDIQPFLLDYTHHTGNAVCTHGLHVCVLCPPPPRLPNQYRHIA